MIFLYTLLSIAACAIVHECGHYFCAKAFGRTIAFRFEWGMLFGKIPVPRFIWDMPDTNIRTQRLIAASGFAAEFAVAILLWLLMDTYGDITLAAASIHLGLYSFYAGESSDFKWFYDTPAPKEEVPTGADDDKS